MTTYWQ